MVVAITRLTVREQSWVGRLATPLLLLAAPEVESLSVASIHDKPAGAPDIVQLLRVLAHVDCRGGFGCETVMLFGTSLLRIEWIILVQYGVWVGCLFCLFGAVDDLLAVAQILQILHAGLMFRAFLNHAFLLVDKRFYGLFFNFRWFFTDSVIRHVWFWDGSLVHLKLDQIVTSLHQGPAGTLNNCLVCAILFGIGLGSVFPDSDRIVPLR